MKSALPRDAVWAGFGIGAATFEMVAQSVLLGGNVRVGFEDTFHLEKGKMAKSNKELVEKGRFHRTASGAGTGHRCGGEGDPGAQVMPLRAGAGENRKIEYRLLGGCLPVLHEGGLNKDWLIDTK